MRLTASDAERRPPYCCIFCKGSEGLIDSLYDLDAYPGFELNGTLYICTPCAQTAGQAAGMAPMADRAELENALSALEFDNAILRERQIEDIDALIAAVRERKATKPKEAANA